MSPARAQRLVLHGLHTGNLASDAVALHDCDILTYDRSLLARLIYPVAHPQFSFEFCKGYYARVASNKLNGRACRLLVGPLIHATKRVLGENDFLNYLDSFRYLLAGEFAFRRDLLNDMRVPSDWGLEMGVASEMYRNNSTNRICQVELTDFYDHKHQDLSANDAQRGYPVCRLISQNHSYVSWPFKARSLIKKPSARSRRRTTELHSIT